MTISIERMRQLAGIVESRPQYQASLTESVSLEEQFFRDWLQLTGETSGEFMERFLAPNAEFFEANAAALEAAGALVEDVAASIEGMELDEARAHKELMKRVAKRGEEPGVEDYGPSAARDGRANIASALTRVKGTPSAHRREYHAGQAMHASRAARVGKVAGFDPSKRLSPEQMAKLSPEMRARVQDWERGGKTTVMRKIHPKKRVPGGPEREPVEVDIPPRSAESRKEFVMAKAARAAAHHAAAADNINARLGKIDKRYEKALASIKTKEPVSKKRAEWFSALDKAKKRGEKLVRGHKLLNKTYDLIAKGHNRADALHLALGKKKSLEPTGERGYEVGHSGRWAHQDTGDRADTRHTSVSRATASHTVPEPKGPGKDAVVAAKKRIAKKERDAEMKRIKRKEAKSETEKPEPTQD